MNFDQILELQNTLHNLSLKIDSVKEKHLTLNYLRFQTLEKIKMTVEIT